MTLPTALSSLAFGFKPGAAVGEGISKGQALDYQAQVARNNATIAKQNAAYASEAGGVRTEQEGLKARAESGSVRAGLAANGLDVNSGSAADVQTSQREIGALDQDTVAHEAAIQAYGYRTQETGFQDQATLLRSEAAKAPLEGAFNAVGSLIGSAPSLPSAFSWMSQDDGGATPDELSGALASGAF